MENMKTKNQLNETCVLLNSCVEMESLFGAHKADISMINASLKAYTDTAFKIDTKVADSPKNSDIINYRSVVSCKEASFFCEIKRDERIFIFGGIVFC